MAIYDCPFCKEPNGEKSYGFSTCGLEPWTREHFEKHKRECVQNPANQRKQICDLEKVVEEITSILEQLVPKVAAIAQTVEHRTCNAGSQVRLLLAAPIP